MKRLAAWGHSPVARGWAWLIALGLLSCCGDLARGQTPAAKSAAAQSEPGKKARPNVLFIAVDDLNDWVGVLDGYPGVQTPNLDKLARRSTLFTRAYCAAPACNPSRAALLTGVRPSTSGVYHNDQPWRPAMPDAVTLPQHFTQAGYLVLGGGKLFHNSFNDLPSWERYQNRPGDPTPDHHPLNGIANTAHFDWGPLQAKKEDMGDWKLANWAAEELQKERDRPLFLAVGFIKPHLPFYAPQEYFDRYPLGEIKLPPFRADDLGDVPPIGKKMANPLGDHRKVVDSKNWEKAVQAYLATITFTDECIGRVLDALERSPNRDNTIVILWSDHGWHLGEKSHWRKFALWEEATRVVCLASVPGMTPPTGARCERTVSLLDIYPTMIDLCQLPARKGLEGKSLLPLLQNAQAEWDRPVLTTHGLNNHAVRSERWRYIRYEDGTEELYDHQADPNEWTNLAGQEQHAPVRAELARWLPEVNAPNAAREAGKGQKKKQKTGNSE